MSNPNYPPGPWECEEQWHGTAIKVVDSGETVARVSRRADFEREVATALLISSAPDLYEACILAERALRLGIPQEAVTLINEKGDFDSIVIARIRLEEAIARVKGREDV